MLRRQPAAKSYHSLLEPGNAIGILCSPVDPGTRGRPGTSTRGGEGLNRSDAPSYAPASFEFTSLKATITISQPARNYQKMDFLKKAKSKLNEIEGDLTKATQAFGLGDKKEASAPADAPSTASSSAAPPSDVASPASTTMNTPSTSTTPTIASGPKAKLPLAIRKQGRFCKGEDFAASMYNEPERLTPFAVRDEYEVKIPELESNLSAVCGVPWKLLIDPGAICAYCEDRYSKEYPGKMITK